MNSNLLFSFLLPLQFAFTSKWHKSQRNLILKDTNSYLLYSICLRDKRRIGSLDYSSKWRTLKLLKTVVWRHTRQPVSSPGRPWSFITSLGGVRNKQNQELQWRVRWLLGVDTETLAVSTLLRNAHAHLLAMPTSVPPISCSKWGK